ncbi:MAG: DUF3631 domain-containing protein [Betaproteobacteria bacterium]|nr:DUF3631 domain-containing protein [Betaproteobacteria bacterium]
MVVEAGIDPTVEVDNPLDEVEAFLARFVAYPSEAARVAHVLWIGHAHLMDCWESTPRIAFLSPEPGSGKSRALEASELLVPLPVQAVNVTPAYLFRKVGSENGRPTVLYDEIDTVFGPKAKDNEEIRGLLNAGHRRSGVAGRCVVRGKQVFTEEIPAYCAVALAGLGGLPDTILSRSVIVRMRRRAPNEQVEPFRRRVHEGAGDAIRHRLEAWAIKVQPEIGDPWPEMPAGIVDRSADVWEALLAVADAAGGAWPARGRVAAVSLVAESKGSTPSLGVRLLEDLRHVFGDREHMATDDILKGLCQIDEAPWGDIRGKAIDARGLAQRLRPYGVASKQVRISAETTLKGYARADLHDAWERYLGPSHHGSETSETSETTETPAAPVSDVSDVSDAMGGEPMADEEVF